MTIHGTKDFWGGDPDTDTCYQDNRSCIVCGGPLTDRADGRLCRVCNNRRRSNECHAFVEMVCRAWRQKLVRGWFENVQPPVSLRVVGVTLWAESERRAWEEVA